MQHWFKFCPSCGMEGINWLADRFWHCSVCGFEYYHNVACAAGVIMTRGNTVLTLVRAREPAQGRLALPGGFVDPGEQAEAAARRECQEELGWQPQTLHFLCSHPNTYEYRTIVYHTCDLFFTADASDLTEQALTCNPAEVAGIRWIDPSTIPACELAFESTRQALRDFLSRPTTITSPANHNTIPIQPRHPD